QYSSFALQGLPGLESSAQQYRGDWQIVRMDEPVPIVQLVRFGASVREELLTERLDLTVTCKGHNETGDGTDNLPEIRTCGILGAFEVVDVGQDDEPAHDSTAGVPASACVRLKP